MVPEWHRLQGQLPHCSGSSQPAFRSVFYQNTGNSIRPDTAQLSPMGTCIRAYDCLCNLAQDFLPLRLWAQRSCGVKTSSNEVAQVPLCRLRSRIVFVAFPESRPPLSYLVCRAMMRLKQPIRQLSGQFQNRGSLKGVNRRPVLCVGRNSAGAMEQTCRGTARANVLFNQTLG